MCSKKSSLSQFQRHLRSVVFLLFPLFSMSAFYSTINMMNIPPLLLSRSLSSSSSQIYYIIKKSWCLQGCVEHAVSSTLIHTHTQDKQHPGISELMGDSKITHTEKMNVCACVMTGHAVVLRYSWINQTGKIVLPRKIIQSCNVKSFCSL